MIYSVDFETTTDINDCRVWAYGMCEVNNVETFEYGNNINDFMKRCENSNNSIFYFHNLKFDGEFILNWLFKHNFKWVNDRKKAFSKSFTTLINDMGQFYQMEIYFNINGHHVSKCTIKDSLKVLPFSVEETAKAFNLPVSKLELDYTYKREINHKLTPHEIEYLKNDVVIIAMALNILFKQGMNKLTTGANALNDFKSMIPP